MGYTKSWVPPLHIGNNLTQWKLICQDIHNNMEDCGLSVAADTGQLDISSVSVLPSHGTFAGFKMYEMNDLLALPIFIKLEFGVSSMGLNHYGYAAHKSLRIRVTIGTSTDGSGTITSQSIQYQCPQEYSPEDGSNYVTSSSNGISLACYNQDRGFLGFAYQIEGGRNDPLVSGGGNQYGEYSGSSLFIAIQRSKTDAGVPTDDGFSVLYPNLTDLTNYHRQWSDGFLQNSQTKYFDAGTGVVSQPTNQYSRALTHPYSGKTALDSPYVFNDTNGLMEMDCLAIGKIYAASGGQEITAELVPGVSQNMVSIGRETSLSFLPSGQRHCVFMLFE